MGTQNEPLLFLQVETGNDVCVFDIRVAGIFDMRESLLEDRVGTSCQLLEKIIQSPLVAV